MPETDLKNLPELEIVDIDKYKDLDKKCDRVLKKIKRRKENGQKEVSTRR